MSVCDIGLERVWIFRLYALERQVKEPRTGIEMRIPPPNAIRPLLLGFREEIGELFQTLLPKSPGLLASGRPPLAPMAPRRALMI